MKNRVSEILSWYGSDSPGTRMNLARLMNHGRLAGTGRFVILPVDQGFEHGPARSFAINPAGYDPRYHFELAIAAGCNAYAAPLGFLEAGAAEFAGEVPLILKLNNSDSLYGGSDPCPALTGSVDEALRLGCAAIGFTIYPASSARNERYGQIRELTEEAKRKGLAVVVCSYPRGSGISKEGETAIDVVAYAAQIACQLGAHIVTVKPPTSHIEQVAATKVYEKQRVPIDSLADRVRHVVQSAFGGRRIIIFSGGEAKEIDAIMQEIRGIHEGGGFGSIISQEILELPRAQAIKLIQTIGEIYAVRDQLVKRPSMRQISSLKDLIEHALDAQCRFSEKQRRVWTSILCRRSSLTQEEAAAWRNVELDRRKSTDTGHRRCKRFATGNAAASVSGNASAPRCARHVDSKAGAPCCMPETQAGSREVPTANRDVPNKN